ncbi:hypothetical protein ACOSQ2_005335 [Xanthoceras sorbifolium]
MMPHCLAMVRSNKIALASAASGANTPSMTSKPASNTSPEELQITMPKAVLPCKILSATSVFTLIQPLSRGIQCTKRGTYCKGSLKLTAKNFASADLHQGTIAVRIQTLL